MEDVFFPGAVQNTKNLGKVVGSRFSLVFFDGVFDSAFNREILQFPLYILTQFFCSTSGDWHIRFEFAGSLSPSDRHSKVVY